MRMSGASVQLGFFATEAQEKEQRKLLNELMDLKASQIQEQMYHNFWGTPEKIRQRQAEVAEKVERFRERVLKAFPHLVNSGQGPKRRDVL